jgi:hypothetical protein
LWNTPPFMQPEAERLTRWDQGLNEQLYQLRAAFHGVVGLAHGGVLVQATESPREFTRQAARVIADALRPIFAPVPTAADWGIEVSQDVAGMVRQWRIEGLSYSALARTAERTLGAAPGGDWQFGMALCRASAARLGEDPWSVSDRRPARGGWIERYLVHACRPLRGDGIMIRMNARIVPTARR